MVLPFSNGLKLGDRARVRLGERYKGVVVPDLFLLLHQVLHLFESVHRTRSVCCTYTTGLSDAAASHRAFQCTAQGITPPLTGEGETAPACWSRTRCGDWLLRCLAG